MCIRMSRGNTCRIVFTGRAKSPRRGWTRCGRTRDGSASHGSCIREPTASSVPHVARVAATCSRSVRGRIDNCASLFSRVFHLVRFAVESIWLPTSILRAKDSHTPHKRRPKLVSDKFGLLPVKRHRGEPGHTRDRHKNLTNQPHTVVRSTPPLPV